jgi:hypothetical protein
MVLLTVVASGLAAQDPEPVPVEPDAGSYTADTATDWQSELDRIADLLIDGKPLEAKQQAEILLAREDLPEHAAARARALRDKAAARTAESPPATNQRPAIVIPPENETTGETATGEKEQVFRVRLAAADGGFSQGVSGQLRVAETGISFVRQGKTREDWTIRWRDLAEAKNDTGLWDVPYPLVLIERGGGRRYVARLDQKGTYLPGAPLLSAIAEERRRQSARKAPADPKEGE